MSEESKNETYGRTARRIKELEDDLQYIEMDLTHVGNAFQETGKRLLKRSGVITLDRESVDISVAKAFEALDKYNAANAELAKKRAELERLR